MQVFRIATASVLLAGLVGCAGPATEDAADAGGAAGNSADSGLPPMGTAAERNAAAEAWLDFYCRARLVCPLESPLMMPAPWFDYATLDGCKAIASAKGTGGIDWLLEPIRTGVVRLTAAGKACLTAPIACGWVFPLCYDGLAGTLANGAACDSDFACATGSCGSLLAACGHVCRAPATCGGKACAHDEVCSLDSLCHKRMKAGDSCASLPCADPLECDPVDRVCKVRAGPGGACSLAVGCVAGLKCHFTGLVPETRSSIPDRLPPGTLARPSRPHVRGSA